MFSVDGDKCLEPMFCSNLDLENVVTPVDANQFEKLLRETNFDAKETRFIIQGFRDGFDRVIGGLRMSPRGLKI